MDNQLDTEWTLDDARAVYRSFEGVCMEMSEAQLTKALGVALQFCDVAATEIAAHERHLEYCFQNHVLDTEIEKARQEVWDKAIEIASDQMILNEDIMYGNADAVIAHVAESRLKTKIIAALESASTAHKGVGRDE